MNIDDLQPTDDRPLN